MEEIKVGEYIKTVAGSIGKIISFNDGMYTAQMKDATIDLYIDDIKNHKENIIDLIEEGDYVNGMKVQEIIAEGIPQSIICVGGCVAFPSSIKRIVTKEQFKDREYIVGDESNVKD